jgi:predicted transcriptional regulator of viral defense system
MAEKIRGEKKRIYEMIKSKEKITLKEIRASTNINKNTIRSAVISLNRAGLIERIGKGTYKAK